MNDIQYNRLKVVLAEKGVTNKKLAEHLERTEATISRWCKNARQPSIEELFKIARFLDSDIRELLNGTKENFRLINY